MTDDRLFRPDSYFYLMPSYIFADRCFIDNVYEKSKQIFHSISCDTDQKLN